MSIVANFDINLRGNTGSIDKAADGTAAKISKLRESVDHHGSGIGNKFSELGGKIKAAFAALPGASVITAVLSPAVYLGTAVTNAFVGMVPAIAAATTSMGAFGAVTTIATAGLNLIIAAVAATGAAAIGAGMAWTGLGLSAMGGIKDAQKAADKLGMSVEDVQGFAFKSKMDVEELGDTLFKLQHSIGSSEKGKAFAALGLDQATLKSKNLGDAVRDIATAFESVHNAADRTDKGFDLVGKSAANLLKLVKGGAVGIEAAMAEARSLGDIVAANEEKQVAEASAALRQMKFALGGLAKTAAITIAPFVKMVADAITSALKYLHQFRERIINFAYGVEFAFKNFSDYVRLYFGKALLSVTEFANAVVHFFTDVIPQLFVSFGRLLQDGITSGFAKGFDAAWQKAIADVKASMKRESGEFETELRKRVNALEQRLAERKAKFLADKMAAIAPPGAGESNLGGERRDNTAVERGSAEAFKIIAGQQGDKMYKIANDQLAVLRKLLEEAKKKKRGGVNIQKARV